MSLTINSFGYSSISSLFANSTANSSMFGGLEASLTNYSQIKSGSYGKLVQSYYSKYDGEGNLKSDSNTKKESTKNTDKAPTGYLAKAREEKARDKGNVTVIKKEQAKPKTNTNSDIVTDNVSTKPEVQTDKAKDAKSIEVKDLKDIKSYTNGGQYAKTMDDLLSTFDTTT